MGGMNPVETSSPCARGVGGAAVWSDRLDQRRFQLDFRSSFEWSESGLRGLPEAARTMARE